MTLRRLAIVVLLLAAGGLGGIAMRGTPPAQVLEAIAAPAPAAAPVVRVLAAARALMDGPLDAEAIVRKSLDIAADICVYTNRNVTIETLKAA
jgi:ATP-dependent HslUV protease subunit HslV